MKWKKVQPFKMLHGGDPVFAEATTLSVGKNIQVGSF